VTARAGEVGRQRAVFGSPRTKFVNPHRFVFDNRCRLTTAVDNVPFVRTPAELTEAFRQRGLKITPQRQCIFRILHEAGTHPTAEAVYAVAAAEMPSISLRTVYQTLNDLAAMGEIQTLDVGTGSTRFDPNVRDHHHLVCDRCGMVRDVEVDTSAIRLSPAVLDGFGVGRVDVVFRGRCPACRSAAS
jgi:Fe2+ or Zn2+ uptake regulation protein